MKVISMSDLHGFLPKSNTVPECDVVCICGDIVPLEYQNNAAQSISWFCLDFVPWTDSLKCKRVVFIGGNHDFWLETLMYKPNGDLRTASYVLKDLLPGNNKGKHKLIYLRDSLVEIEGVTFYGSPWITDLKDWAFYGDSVFLTEIWDYIPKRLDVLLTHQPPNISDMGTVLQGDTPGLNNFGSDILTKKLLDREIRYTFCGHVHSGNHELMEYKPGCFITNVSVKDEFYQPKWGHNFTIYDI